jgi:hypothetical protein
VTFREKNENGGGTSARQARKQARKQARTQAHLQLSSKVRNPCLEAAERLAACVAGPITSACVRQTRDDGVLIHQLLLQVVQLQLVSRFQRGQVICGGSQGRSVQQAL